MPHCPLTVVKSVARRPSYEFIKDHEIPNTYDHDDDEYTASTTLLSHRVLSISSNRIFGLSRVR